MSKIIQGYEFIAELLKGYKVTHIFFIEAILRKSIKLMEEIGIRGIMAHTENAAGYMADGYARITGRPGVCGAQSIGSANLAGGIQDAWLANTPVIAITGKKTAAYQYKNSYQEADHRLIFEGLTKFNADVTQPDQLPHVLRQAFRAATTGKPRPVHIDIPNHIGRVAEMASLTVPVFIEEAYSRYPAYRPPAEEGKLSEAAAAVDSAQRPVIVAGRGAIISGAKKEIHNLAEKGDIPVATTPDGKTVIDESDGLWAGIVGGYGMDCANRTVRDADLVIYIGAQTGDQNTLDWKIPKLETKVIQIDIEASELGRNYPNTIGLPGDAKVVARQLTRKIAHMKRNLWRRQVSDYVHATLEEYDQYIRGSYPLIRPERLCDEISKVLPGNAVLVSDTGFSATWSATMLRMKTSQTYIRAAGSLGWAFPGSLGVKCGVPERPVVCLTGDGGFYYHANEMETAVRYGIQVVTVVNNNNVLAQCLIDLNQVHSDKADKGTKRVTFTPVNFSRLAEEMGCLGIRVEQAEDIGPAIQKALAENRPAVVEVMTDPQATVPLPLLP